MYDFKQLSPADFEELTRDLLQKHWTIRLESFKTGRDHGIDLRCAGFGRPLTVVQCKHFAGSGVAKLVSELHKSELPKIRKLAPSRYVLVTSLPLSPADKDKIQAAVDPYIRTPDDIFGAEDLNNLLGECPEIEQRHFKLWLSSTTVLERVLHNAEKIQTDFDVERIRRLIPLYVQTKSYPRAMQILEQGRFVIISGVPGIGKTTLANMLLFAHLESGYEPIVIQSSIAEGKIQFKKGTRQVFYFDDFLGDTFLGARLSDFLGKKEDSVILNFMELVVASKHSRFILTTREHILSHAFQVSESFHRRLTDLVAHCCILDIDNYTLLDRGRILYNHICFSELPEDYRQELLRDDFYMRILKHRNYNPRLVEWLSRYSNVKGLLVKDYQERVTWILENPEELWGIAFEQQISEASRSLILALYSLGGTAHLEPLEDAWRALHEYRSKRYKWTTSAEDWRRSLKDLEGGFLSYKNRTAEFVNPSVKDFLDALLVQTVDHFNDLLSAVLRFRQVIVLWKLAISQKGGVLLERIIRRPEQMLFALNRTLLGPHKEKVVIATGSYGFRYLDVRPEVRLRTLISVADRTRSATALKAAAEYMGNIKELWEKDGASCPDATEVLSTIDAAEWRAIAETGIHGQLKAELLTVLEDCPKGGDIDALLEYSSGKGAQWTQVDESAVEVLASRYLEGDFLDELGRCRDEDDVHAISERLEAISDCLGLDVEGCRDQVSERMSELARPEPDRDDQQLRSWERGDDQIERVDPETELKHLFDGLR